MSEEVPSALRFSAGQYSMDVRIYQYSNEVPKDIRLNDQQVMNFHFSNLKKRGFSFNATHLDDNGVFKGDNYGNYTLPLITLSDFKKIEMAAEDAIGEYLRNTFVNIGVSKRRRGTDAYIETIRSSLKFFLSDPIYSFELDVEKLERPERRHQFYSLWEHFKTYLFFFNYGNADELIYIEAGYD